MIYESSPQPITWNKLYASNASPGHSSPNKALRKDRGSIFNEKIDPATGVRISLLAHPLILLRLVHSLAAPGGNCGTKVENRFLRKCLIFIILARFSGETGSIGPPKNGLIALCDQSRTDECPLFSIVSKSFMMTRTSSPRYPPQLSKDQNLEVRGEDFPRKKIFLAN